MRYRPRLRVASAALLVVAAACSDPVFPDSQDASSVRDGAAGLDGSIDGSSDGSIDGSAKPLPEGGERPNMDATMGPDASNDPEASVMPDAASEAGSEAGSETEGGVSRFRIDGPKLVATGHCVQLLVSLADAQTGAAVTATLDSGGRGTFHTSVSCDAGSASAELEVPANGSAVALFWKPQLTAGDYVAQATLTANAPSLSGSADVEVRRAAVEVATGGSFASAVLDDGTVWLWGRSEGTGQFDDANTLFIVDAPTRVPGIAGGTVRSLVAGKDFACVMVGDSVRCFGAFNRVGDSGADTSSTPVATPKGMASGVTHLSALAGHACAVRQGGVWCWGDAGDAERNPVQVGGLGSDVVQVAAGGSHNCALLTGGGVRCWGENNFGQLGDGTETDSLTTPVTVQGLGSDPITSIHTSLYSSCVLASEQVKCWGDMTGKVPGPLAGLDNGVRALSLGSLHYCATNASATTCWGNNDMGQLGAEPFDEEGPPGVLVDTIGADIAQIDAGYNRSTCAISRGLIHCWGSNVQGELGASKDLGRLRAATLVPSMADKSVSKLSFGPDFTKGGLVTCAATDADTFCWGSNYGGYLGLASTAENASTVLPFEVKRDGTDLGPATKLASYNGATCAIVGSELVCWGEVPGAIDREPMALALPGGSTPVDVCLSEKHGCVLLSGASSGAYCWGSDEGGRLGDVATHGSEVGVPVAVATSGTATAIACGLAGSCAIVNGGVECWGEQVADGDSHETPVAIVGLEPALGTHPTLRSVAISEHAACALTEAGEVWCWVGNSTPAVKLLGGKVIDRIAGGGFSTFCARHSQGLICWGANNFGQADPQTTGVSSVTPTSVKGLVAPIGDFATGITSCAVDAVGMKCWGSNATRTGGGDARFLETTPVLTRAFVE